MGRETRHVETCDGCCDGGIRVSIVFEFRVHASAPDKVACSKASVDTGSISPQRAIWACHNKRAGGLSTAQPKPSPNPW